MTIPSTAIWLGFNHAAPAPKAGFCRPLFRTLQDESLAFNLFLNCFSAAITRGS